MDECTPLLSGSKLLAAAPWERSEELLFKAGRKKKRGGTSGEIQYDDADGEEDWVEEKADGDEEEQEEEEEEEEEEEGSVLTVPVHRKLTKPERAVLTHPGLCVVHARPGDCVVGRCKLQSVLVSAWKQNKRFQVLLFEINPFAFCLPRVAALIIECIFHLLPL